MKLCWSRTIISKDSKDEIFDPVFAPEVFLEHSKQTIKTNSYLEVICICCYKNIIISLDNEYSNREIFCDIYIFRRLFISNLLPNDPEIMNEFMFASAYIFHMYRVMMLFLNNFPQTLFKKTAERFLGFHIF